MFWFEFDILKFIFERCNINFEYDNYYQKILQYQYVKFRKYYCEIINGDIRLME